jgi:hypothetical protein
MTAIPGNLRRQLSHQRRRDRDWRPGDLGLHFLSRVLDMRVNDGTHEINVFRPQPARLAQPQPDQRAEQHREPDALREQVI